MEERRRKERKSFYSACHHRNKMKSLAELLQPHGKNILGCVVRGGGHVHPDAKNTLAI